VRFVFRSSDVGARVSGDDGFVLVAQKPRNPEQIRELAAANPW
jgi:hypothetical protein